MHFLGGDASCEKHSYNAALSRSVGQAVFILGDFNAGEITGQLSNLHQYVSCPTCLHLTLGHCYGAIPEACVAHCRLPWTIGP